MALKIFQEIPDQLKKYAWSVWDGHDSETMKDAAKEAISKFKEKFGLSPEALWLDKKKKHIWLWHRDLRKVAVGMIGSSESKKVAPKPPTEARQPSKKFKRGTVKLRRKSKSK